MYKEVIIILKVNKINFRNPITERIRKREEEQQKECVRRELIEDIEYITMRLKQIQDSYDLVCENELIEAMIFEERALKAKYAYLLRLAKEKKIKCRMVIQQ